MKTNHEYILQIMLLLQTLNINESQSQVFHKIHLLRYSSIVAKIFNSLSDGQYFWLRSASYSVALEVQFLYIVT